MIYEGRKAGGGVAEGNFVRTALLEEQQQHEGNLNSVREFRCCSEDAGEFDAEPNPSLL